MSSQPSQGRWYRLYLYSVCYIGWILLSALSLWILLQLRINLLDLVVALELGPWIMGAVDKFGFFILGIAWLIWVLWMEHHLRTGVERDQIRFRLLRTFGIEVLVLALSYGLQFLATR